MRTIITCMVAALFFGCGSAPKAKIKGGEAIGPKDNGTPAVVEAVGTVTTVALPTGSTVESVPATAEEPATVKVTLAAPSEMRTETHTERASTGTVDTSVAKKRIEVESAARERGPLLWVAIGCGLVGVLAFVVLKEWPIIGKTMLTASALAGLAWKLAEVPAWLWLGALGLGAVIIAVYKRAEWDRNNNGVPDALEGRKK